MWDNIQCSKRIRMISGKSIRSHFISVVFIYNILASAGDRSRYFSKGGGGDKDGWGEDFGEIYIIVYAHSV